jgi:hypothetical protein
VVWGMAALSCLALLALLVAAAGPDRRVAAAR